MKSKEESKVVGFNGLLKEIEREIDKWVEEGSILVSCRIAYGMTQKGLAEKLKVPVYKLREMEYGIQRLNSQQRAKIMMIFDLPPGTLKG